MEWKFFEPPEIAGAITSEFAGHEPLNPDSSKVFVEQLEGPVEPAADQP